MDLNSKHGWFNLTDNIKYGESNSKKRLKFVIDELDWLDCSYVHAAKQGLFPQTQFRWQKSVPPKFLKRRFVFWYSLVRFRLQITSQLAQFICDNMLNSLEPTNACACINLNLIDARAIQTHLRCVICWIFNCKLHVTRLSRNPWWKKGNPRKKMNIQSVWMSANTSNPSCLSWMILRLLRKWSSKRGEWAVSWIIVCHPVISMGPDSDVKSQIWNPDFIEKINYWNWHRF